MEMIAHASDGQVELIDQLFQSADLTVSAETSGDMMNVVCDEALHVSFSADYARFLQGEGKEAGAIRKYRYDIGEEFNRKFSSNYNAAELVYLQRVIPGSIREGLNSGVENDILGMAGGVFATLSEFRDMNVGGMDLSPTSQKRIARIALAAVVIACTLEKDRGLNADGLRCELNFGESELIATARLATEFRRGFRPPAEDSPREVECERHC